MGFVSRFALGAIVGAAACAGGCAPELDTRRVTSNRGSLGREMYTMICDRVGAQALREDVAGASYHSVCHASPQGEFADHVDLTKLTPIEEAVDVDGKPVTLEQQLRNREHRIARVEAVARRRQDLVVAFDTAFAHENIALKDLANPDEARSCEPLPGAPPSEADLRVELGDMLSRLGDLYNDDTLPQLTRALSRMMDDVDHAPAASVALARFDARRGYRPKDIAMGVSRPMASYPRLVELANALLRLLSSDIDPQGMLPAASAAPRKKPQDRTAADRVPGKAHGALIDLLGVMKEELRTAKPLPDLPVLATTTDARDKVLVRLSG